MTSIFVSGTGSTATFNSGSASSWFAHQKTTTTFRETGLTDPGTSTVSDVMLSFMGTVNGSTVNVIALVSDPTLVADIPAINAPTATTPETGALQNVTTLVFPTSAPLTVSVLSAVPEASSWMLMFGGLGAIALAVRRRRPRRAGRQDGRLDRRPRRADRTGRCSRCQRALRRP